MNDPTSTADSTPPATSPLPSRAKPQTPPFRVPAAALAIAASLSVAVVWSYWTTLGQLAERWWVDPQYSHGFLVPLFAAVVLWLKRPLKIAGQPSVWGLLILAVSLAPRWFTARMDLAYLDGACMIGSLLGVVLLVGGWDVLRWTWPAILFLGFIIPLPHTIEENIAIPLRRLATVVSTYVLQTFGYPALAEGNTIHIGQIRLGVIDACSGLGMLMTFFALATAMAMVVPGPIVDRVALVISAAPIAVFANVLRITITAMAYASLGWQDHREAIHDALGLLMMPWLALLLLWLESKYLRALLISIGDKPPLTVPLSPWMDRAEPTKSTPQWS
jgi:exosortase